MKSNIEVISKEIKMQSPEWGNVRLNEVVRIQNGYAFKSKNFSINGNPVIKIKNVNGRFVDVIDTQFYPNELCGDLGKFLINNDDILIAMTGAGSVGRVSKFKQKNSMKYYLNQRVGKIIPDKYKLDNEFLFQVLSTKTYEKILFDLGNGSGQPNLSPATIGLVNIPLPPIQEQKNIGKVLSDLDEKIETNNQINKTLEEMSAAIFKQWFVDFEFPNENGEPYRSSGGEMVESELGMIPSGWNVETLGKIINISSGKRPLNRTDNKNGESVIPLVGASSIMGYTSEFNYREPILVIGRVGTHGIIQRFNRKVWASDNTLVIKSKYYEYVYQILNMIDYRALNRGSTQPLITQTDIKNSKIILPSAESLMSFESLVSKLFTKHENALIENQKLSIVRDTLLPKLMSGEIRVTIEE